MIDNYEKAKQILEKYKQNHIIPFMDKANVNLKEKLIDQILKIDFEELKELYKMTFEDLYVELEELHPIAGINPDLLPEKQLKKYEKLGEDTIKNNKFAVATMAGGQGTRLRTPKCKGNLQNRF